MPIYASSPDQIGTKGIAYYSGPHLPMSEAEHCIDIVTAMRKRGSHLRVWALLAWVWFGFAQAEPSNEVAKEPPRKTFLIMPLHVHVLSCADRADLDCKLTNDDVD